VNRRVTIMALLVGHPRPTANRQIPALPSAALPTRTFTISMPIHRRHKPCGALIVSLDTLRLRRQREPTRE
jgi:hypothetical protein